MTTEDLIIRSLQGRTSPEDEARLRSLRAQDAEIDRCYRKVAELWTLLEVAEPHRTEDLPDFDVLMERADAEVMLHEGASGESSRRLPLSSRTTFRWGRWAVVGAMAAGLAAVGFGIGIHSGRQDASVFLSESEIVTGSGEMTTLSLGDGSSIRLGPQSRLRLAEEDGQRIAWLDGRAFFGIHSDSTRPFVVRTKEGEAQVLGTRFEVRTEEEFRVLVVDGSVSVRAGGAELQLSEGEMSRSRGGARPSTERVDDVYAYLDWLGNAIVFQGTPLRRALREIERRYDVDVVLEDSALSDFTVTATLTGRSVEQVVFVLCSIVNTTCTNDGDSIRIGRPGRAGTARPVPP